MNYTIGQLVNRIGEGPDATAIILTIENGQYGQILELAYTEGGSGWWPVSCVEVPGEQSIVPRWVDFSAVIMALPSVNLMLGEVLQNAPGPYGGLFVGLQNASEGDSRVFLNSWNAAYTMGLISPELITTVQEIAGEYDLPEAFIGALEPPIINN